MLINWSPMTSVKKYFGISMTESYFSTSQTPDKLIDLLIEINLSILFVYFTSFPLGFRSRFIFLGKCFIVISYLPYIGSHSKKSAAISSSKKIRAYSFIFFDRRRSSSFLFSVSGVTPKRVPNFSPPFLSPSRSRERNSGEAGKVKRRRRRKYI